MFRTPSRTFALATATLLPAVAAEAHPGHVAEVAGHSHWLAVALVLAAAAIGAWRLARPLRDRAARARRRDA